MSFTSRRAVQSKSRAARPDQDLLGVWQPETSPGPSPRQSSTGTAGTPRSGFYCPHRYCSLHAAASGARGEGGKAQRLGTWGEEKVGNRIPMPPRCSACCAEKVRAPIMKRSRKRPALRAGCWLAGWLQQAAPRLEPCAAVTRCTRSPPELTLRAEAFRSASPPSLSSLLSLSLLLFNCASHVRRASRGPGPLPGPGRRTPVIPCDARAACCRCLVGRLRLGPPLIAARPRPIHRAEPGGGGVDAGMRARTRREQYVAAGAGAGAGSRAAGDGDGIHRRVGRPGSFSLGSPRVRWPRKKAHRACAAPLR